MKKYKFIFIIVFLSFLLTGCETDYYINVSEDLAVTETFGFTYTFEPNEEEGYNGPRDIYNSIYEPIMEQAIQSNYKITDNSTDSKIDLKFNRASNFDTFYSPIFDEIYSHFETTCNEDKCSIVSIAYQNDIEGDGTYMDYKIHITVPYKVIKQNADEIDLKNNTYIWYYIVGGKQSNIELVFNRYGKNVIEINKRNSLIMTIVFSIIGLIVFVLISKIIYKIVRNSRPSL